MPKYEFPKDFLWGSATASYQIEGAVNEDGRGESIWDRFCKLPGRVLHGDNGDTACDHYHRFREDIQLMKQLGLKAYRFSIAWPRILPNGSGEINHKGIDFYSALVDELLANGIQPAATLYHWDLPQKLQDIGGWANPEMPRYFADYARILFQAFDGRITQYITLNEPWCSAFLGYYTGEHAPGITDFSTALAASYNLMKAHGLAVKEFRELGTKGEIGITLNLNPSRPLTDSPEDIQAARRADGYANRWFIEPVMLGKFPEDMIELFDGKGLVVPEMRPEDLVLMCQPLDFFGVNYYNISRVRNNPDSYPLGCETISVNSDQASVRGWPIVADGLKEILLRLTNEYHVDKIYVTENGMAAHDIVNRFGQVEDYDRADYLARHFIAAHEAIREGVNLRGYYPWSLYDNFEWAFGRYSRFGMIYIDFDTQQRIIKQSGYFYRDVIAANGLD